MKNNFRELKKIARESRYLILQAVRAKETHHIGCSFSIVDILTYLYYRVLHIDPKNPKKENRDIFILSKGHAALAVYTVLYQKGFFPKEVYFSYDQDGGHLPEHIHHQVAGVEVSTGSLGHGLPVGVGIATSFLNDGKNNKIVVLMSDGELNEGSNWEAIMYAAHHKLKNLTAVVDVNGFQGYAETKKVIDLSPLVQKMTTFGWNVVEADGHDFGSLENAFLALKTGNENKPKMILAKTVKGKGIPFFEGRFDSHYQSIDEQTKEKLLKDFQANL
ncbi:hypothetical protein A2774_00820 [Candidatus Roizmanbacteria bacterium RIFCSPHIGHO2_01_FULL_39_12c]|uniref:Transketolase N-terminal domain-containing protein n=1 Tax=Candidatus Roizmanbacteria bacterium RIFCSPHIGHO2_01_FULL_39_12c TaxID=1802031 RepID=A0A1F7GF68_9BACT|nr:MAG: hypothetical protein A2774_00820 [Candidatus Roizmanbacteria bacterium RIFCSPHIGHO2_01_FULL_39_12c]OGK46534.1 MAG: hypothetical protein A2963_02235 [Candidatus Roizmanbacteria bacterium RIFCSPLOWO2_01_FULL_40_13]